MQNIKKRTDVLAILLLSITVCLMYSAAAFQYSRYAENLYVLSEIDSGVYAIQSQEISAASLRSYDVVEVCIGGTIQRFEGEVKISYTEDEPYAYAQTNELSRCDRVRIYIPRGTLVRQRGEWPAERSN